MKTLRVDLGERSYPIFVGNGVLSLAGRLLSRSGCSAPPIIITNPKIMKLHGRELLRSLETHFGPTPVISIGDGERFKNHATLLKVYDGLFRWKADRHSWILAFGGGVVGDVAGFAAATFMRGIRFAVAPTTLLAQVDSSIGGKVGINVRQGKNLIGAFHQPAAVISDVALLRTLSEREFSAGLYEVIKCGAIRSKALLRYIDGGLRDIHSRKAGALQHIVSEACRIKAQIIVEDEKEDHLRMVLNYGHTVGHALEAATNYRLFRHGEAVAWGMIAAMGFGRELGIMTASEAQFLEALIHRTGKLPRLGPVSFPKLWQALSRDKKIRAGRLHMVLLPRLGATEIRDDVTPQHLKQYLNKFVSKYR